VQGGAGYKERRAGGRMEVFERVWAAQSPRAGGIPPWMDAVGIMMAHPPPWHDAAMGSWANRAC